MTGQMKVGLIGESVTMHYLDYYCEKHKDKIAGFSDVRDDKRYQEDDIDHRMHRVGNKSLRFPERIESGKVFEHFVNHTCI